MGLFFERPNPPFGGFGGIFGCGARIILPPSRASEYTCATNYIEHRTTKTKHPWTNGQIERINRTIKDTTVKRFIMRAATDSANISTISYRPTILPDD
ncbi:transposase InsO family protein [Ochrobactrum sp. RC6B]|nr:transposase InsO family protein [Ochrobactrum sp. RC6B]